MKYTVEQFKTDLMHPYTFPGCYPRYFVTSDGAALSYKSALHNQHLIIDSIENQSSDGWMVIGCDVNWEDSGLFCDDTGERIESAYADDEVTE
jgi:hypothetical protein